MADGSTIFGVDTAKYQPDGTYDPGAFEIINFDDPQRDQKMARNKRDGRPNGVYLWIYSGRDYTGPGENMVDTIRAVYGSDPELGYWADYEDTGVNDGDLHEFFAGMDARGAKSGYYSSPGGPDHSQFLDRPWWNAAYPTGAVAFPGYGSLWSSSRPRPMQMWQYTSANGLDRNVIVDEDWYAAQIHGPAPKPAPLRLEDDMNIAVGPLQGRIGNVAWLLAGSLILAEWSDADGGSGFAGPKKMEAWNDGTGRHYPVHLLDAAMMQALKDRKPVV